MKLFVCYGNSERSVIAEELYKKLTNQSAMSAGVAASKKPRKQAMIDLLKEEGIDITNKPKTRLLESMVQQASQVYVLCQKDQCPDYLKNSPKATFWQIPNPYGRSDQFLKLTKNLIHSYIKSIVEE